jgi:transposase
VLDRLNHHDLSEEEWQRLRPLLPADPPRGGRWADHRTVINGIFFRTRAGCPWRDLPEGFGNWKTVYNRHRRWSLDGTWEQILDGLRARSFPSTLGKWPALLLIAHDCASAWLRHHGRRPTLLPATGNSWDCSSCVRRRGKPGSAFRAATASP